MLDPTKALDLASRLRTIADFPRDDGSLQGTAEDLIDLCGNLSRDGQMEFNRIDWLVREARRNWTRWPGTKALIDLYDNRYRPPRPPENAAKDYGAKPAIECKRCNDVGFYRPKPTEPYQWCECQAGIHLHLDQPRWLDLINQTKPERPAPLPVIDNNPIHPATERELSKVPGCPACDADNHHKVAEWQQFHQGVTA